MGMQGTGAPVGAPASREVAAELEALLERMARRQGDRDELVALWRYERRQRLARDVAEAARREAAMWRLEAAIRMGAGR